MISFTFAGRCKEMLGPLLAQGTTWNCKWNEPVVQSIEYLPPRRFNGLSTGLLLCMWLATIQIDPPWLFILFWGDVWCAFGVLREQEQATAYVTAELMRLTNTYLVPGCRPSLCGWAVRLSASGSTAACIACREGSMPWTRCRRRQRRAPGKD